jgi:Tfp pilus assembly protein PilF
MRQSDSGRCARRSSGATEAKDLFARLAVFAGTFSLSAAETICAADIDLLQGLVEGSLVKQGPDGRYIMLETVRAYGSARLYGRGEPIELRRRHAEFFTRLAEDSEPEIRRDAVRLALAEDEPNLRAALAFCAERREPELMLRLAGALQRFWFNRDQVEEGKRWLEEAIEAAPPTRDRYRARAFRGLAVMHSAIGDLVRADSLIHEALGIYRELGDKDGIARCLNNLGVNTWRQGDADAAQVLFEQSFALTGWAIPLENLTHLALVRGDLVKARTLAERELQAARETHDDVPVLLARRSIAAVAALETRYDAAARLTRELLEDAKHRDLPARTIEFILLAAFITWKQENEEAAAQLAKAAAAERVRLGMPPWESPAFPYAEALVRGLEERGHAPIG